MRPKYHAIDRSMQKRISLLFIVILLSNMYTLSTFAQLESSVPQVFQSIHNDTSPPLREIEELPLMPTPWENGVIPIKKFEAQFEDTYKKDPALQKVMGTTGTSDIIQSWDGISAGPYVPPDPSGDVGPNHYMQMVNIQFQIWDKTGTSLLGPLNLGTLWSGFPGSWASSLNDGDPVVLYDETADRWFASQFSLPNGGSGPEYLLIAVSQTSDPTGAWYRYGFETAQFPDYPKFGVWPDGYYFSVNRFAGGFQGTYAGAMERDKMLIGQPAQMVIFSIPNSISASLLPSDWDGTNTPPTGAPNYFGQIHDNAYYGGTDGFDIFEFHVDWATPSISTFTGPTFLATNAFSQVNGIPQPSPGETLDDLSDRAMNRLNYRNFGTHQSMVACHTVDAGGSRAGMRWYEFRNSGGGWSIYQQGTYAPSDGLERWMGSIAINNNGDIALGYSVSSSTIYPSIRYTGRLSGDTPGTMTIPEETIQAGLGSQVNSYGRWGDYTQMVVDPDGQTFWYVNEYYPSTSSFNWKTRIASFSFGPPCPINPSSNPSPINEATDVSINVQNISWINGAGATQCEVWFGELGSMTKVYDGTLIASWNVPSPLSYYTTYSWQIVGKNGTCSVNGPLWTFTTEQDPNLVIETAFVYPQNLNYWTGTCNSSTKTQISLVDADGNGFAGWMAFDVSSIPNNATITSIIFHAYLYDNNYPYWSITPMGSVNPVTGIASVIYTQVSNSYQQGSAYSYNEETGDLPLGWLQRSLNEGDATTDMQNALGQDWFALGVYDFDNGTTYYVNFQGWAQTNSPYLEVVYEYTPVADPTDVSATAISNTQIDVGFTPNASNDNVLIAWNLTGTFTEPSGVPPAVGQPFAGGTLLYNGTTSPVHHTSLNQLTTYYYKAFSYDNIDYSSGIEVNETTLANPILTDFAVEFLVSDDCTNSISLTFGTAPGATGCFDPGLDELAPPPPPVGAFDGRFTSCNDAFFKDFRATNPDGVRIWDVKYQPATGCEPVSFSWDPGQLPPDGYFHLVDPILGNLVNVNMRTTNNYSDQLALGHLQIKYSYEVCANFDFADGWNMISLPLDVADANYQTLFPNASIGSLFGYLGGYYITELVENCTGYWLKMPSEEIVEVCGLDREECVIGLEFGWNMIGGPNCNVPLGSVSDPGGIIVPGSLFRYAGGYIPSTSIDATEGYWIKANAPGTITVSCGALVTNNRNDLTLPLETLADFGRVEISDASNKSQALYFNGKLDENISIESYSLPPVPPQGSFDARLTGNYRLRESDEVTIQVQSSDYPLSITLTDLNDEEGYELQKIVDGIEVGSHRIVEGVEIVISNENVSLLKITKQEALPTSYNLEQNYPNPFNPATTIKFAVPKETRVNLSIYNILGELISILADEELKPGYYEYDFNATDLASGVYLYRIKAGNFVETKKMVLLR